MNLRKLVTGATLATLLCTGAAEAERRRGVRHPTPAKTTIIPLATAGTDVHLSYHEQGVAQVTTCFVPAGLAELTNCRTDSIPSGKSVELKDYAPTNGMITVSTKYPLEIRSDLNDGFPLISSLGFLPSRITRSNETIIFYTGAEAATAKLTLTGRHDILYGNVMFPPSVTEITVPPYSTFSTDVEKLFERNLTFEDNDLQIRIEMQNGKIGAVTGVTEDGETAYLPALSPEGKKFEYSLPLAEQHDTHITARMVNDIGGPVNWRYRPLGSDEAWLYGSSKPVLPDRIMTTRDIVGLANGAGVGAATLYGRLDERGNPSREFIGWARTDNMYLPLVPEEHWAKAPSTLSADKREAILSNLDNNDQQKTTIYAHAPGLGGTGWLTISDQHGNELQNIPISVASLQGREYSLDSVSTNLENARARLQLDHFPTHIDVTPRVTLIAITEDRATGKKIAAHLPYVRPYE